MTVAKHDKNLRHVAATYGPVPSDMTDSDAAAYRRHALAFFERKEGTPDDLRTPEDWMAVHRTLKMEGDPGASLRERFAKMQDAPQQIADLMYERARRESGGELDRAGWQRDMQETLAAHPELVERDVEAVAPGYLEHVAGIHAEGSQRLAEVAAALDQTAAPFLRGFRSTADLRPLVERSAAASAMDGDDGDKALSRLIRRAVDQGHSEKLLDAADGDEVMEQRIFDAAANGPTEPPEPNPWDKLSDAELERELQRATGAPDAIPTERPLPSGVSFTLEGPRAWNDPANIKAGLEQLEREVRETERADTEAANQSNRENYSHFFEVNK